LIAQDLRSYEPLKDAVNYAYQAALQKRLYAAYPLLVYDRIVAALKAQMTKSEISKEQYDLYMKPWKDVEAELGSLDDQDYYDQLDFSDFRRWFAALHEMIDLMGMGLRTSTKTKELPDPMAMWKYHECPEDCPLLVAKRDRQQRYE
jgi:hypothetical protein